MSPYLSSEKVKDDNEVISGNFDQGIWCEMPCHDHTVSVDTVPMQKNEFKPNRFKGIQIQNKRFSLRIILRSVLRILLFR